MTKENEIYKCSVCGDIISVIFAGSGTLVCCGKNMELLKEKTSKEEGKEKHVPVMDISDNLVTVRVGSVLHPMEEKHFIVLVQLVRDGKVIAGKRLYPGDKPEVEFCVDDTNGLSAREICNIHGLWIN